ncbi:MAG TPA: glycosyl transferase [Desulfomonilaceae bacterium]|nr:glycosyl transferase [Desulfomonilaceae bacterium]
MSDFQQTEPISTLHMLGNRNLQAIEKEIEEASKSRPIALVLPCLISEMDGPALQGIMNSLESVNYLREVLVTLGPATYEEFQRACEYFMPLQKPNRRVRIIWNDGKNVQSLYEEIREAGLSPGPHGKGRSAWTAYGYVVARGESCIIALHDCDIVSYSKNLLNRLVYPTVMPDLDYKFCKGYYSRVTDRMHGRVTRLLITPLIHALIKILGPLPLLQYLNSFRYPLSGEFSMVADLALINRIPADWGLEMGVLAEVFRNCSLNWVCQVELCENYDHKHQELSEDDPEKGLNKMSIDVCATLFRVLCSSGAVFGPGFFNALRATFLEEAQDLMLMYYSDARVNGLQYDRHSESKAFETFAEAIRIAGDAIESDPMGTPPISNWNRVFSAIPNFAPKLVDFVDQDNKNVFN